MTLRATKKYTIAQGSTWTFKAIYYYPNPDPTAIYIHGPPRDLTDYQAVLQVRRNERDSVSLLTATTSNGLISIPDPTNGEVIVNVPDEITKLLDFDCGVFELQVISPGGEVTRLIKAEVELSLGVNR